MLKRIFFIIFLLTFSKNLFAFKIVDPKDRFKTIETQNFYIHYPDRLKDIAIYISEKSEFYREQIQKYIKYAPSEKTQIVILDYSDFLDGLTTVLPENRIYLNLTPPHFKSTLGEFINYIDTVLAHEYLHVVVMDANAGHSKILRKIFGKPAIPFENPSAIPFFIFIAPPNVFLPKWWHEGFATYGEGFFTGKGRLNSTLIKSYLRLSVKEGNLPKIDELNGDSYKFPKGNTPYLWGGVFFEYVAKKYGFDKISDLIDEHASNLPYIINRVPIRHFGSDYSALYEKAINDLIREKKEEIEGLMRQTITTSQSLKLIYDEIESFDVDLKAGILAVDTYSPHMGHRLIGINLSDYKEIFNIEKTSFSENIKLTDKGVYFTQLIFKSPSNIKQDLFFYEFKNKKISRLTFNKRVKEFVLNNEKIILISKDGPHEKIIEIDKDRSEREIFSEKGFSLSHISLSPDGKSLLFIAKDLEGHYFLNLLEVENKKLSTIFSSSLVIAYPFFSQNLNDIYFVSNLDDVFNLYKINLNSKNIKKLTHLLDGMLNPKAVGDFIYFLSPTSSGYTLSYLKVNDLLENEISFPLQNLPPKRLEELIAKDSPFIEQEYSPLSSIYPKFFLPFFLSDPEGGVFGILTANQDVLGRHTYYAEIDLGLESNNLYHRFKYINESFEPTLMLQSYSYPIFYSKINGSYDFWEREDGLSLSSSLPIRIKKTKVIAGIELLKKSSFYRYRFDYFEGNKNSLFLEINYNDTKKYPLSPGTAKGASFSLKHNQYLDALNSHIKGYETVLSSSFLTPLFLEPNKKILGFYLNLGLSNETRTAQNAFQIGGPPDPLNRFPLRGYGQRFSQGSYVTTATLEYKEPLTYLYKGFGTKPLFLEKLYGSVFIDAGEVWDKDRSFKLDELKSAIGLELKLDITLGYWAKLTPALGITKGLTGDGIWQVYFNVYQNF